MGEKSFAGKASIPGITVEASSTTSHPSASETSNPNVIALIMMLHKSGFCVHHPNVRLREMDRNGNVTRILENNCHLCASVEPFDAILDEIQKHIDSEEILENHLIKLQELASINNRDKIVKKEGIEKIGNAMKHYSTWPKAQQHGIGALGSLARNNDENKKEFAEKGGILAIVRAMQYQSEEAYVQEEGCKELWNLAMNDTNKVTIASEKGIDMIVSAI